MITRRSERFAAIAAAIDELVADAGISKVAVDVELNRWITTVAEAMKLKERAAITHLSDDAAALIATHIRAAGSGPIDDESAPPTRR